MTAPSSIAVFNESDTKKQDKNLKTPQSLIHIKHRISLQQYKYWILLLQELKEQMTAGVEPDEEGFYLMSMDKLAEFIGYTQKKSIIWQDLLALKNETIAFNVLNKDGEQEKYGAGFISEWKVSNYYIRFKFPSFLVNVMKGMENERSIFSMLNWSIFNHFSGKYEAIIYKLCKDYIGVGRTPNMGVDDFRAYLGLKDGEYKEFKDLNKWVISKSVNLINNDELCDILVTPNFYREGRKVLGLFFKIDHKKQTQLPFLPLEDNNAFELAKMPIAPAIQNEYLSIRSADEIKLCIKRANDYGEEQDKLKKPVKNWGALYRKAIEKGWHIDEMYKQAQKEKRQAEKRTRLEAEKKTDRENKEEAKQAEIKKKIRDQIYNYVVSSITKEELSGLEKEFEKSTKKIYAKGTLTYEINFKIFVANKYGLQQ